MMSTNRNSREKKTFSISVTSGKGGVGKTLTTVSLAAQFRRIGKSVLVLDGDMGLANCDVVMGMTARYNIRDVLDGHVELKDIIITNGSGIDLIPSGSGIRELATLSEAQRIYLVTQLAKIESKYDILLIDTGAGIGDLVLHLNACADLNLVVTTPEPHALTDAYALIKVLTEENNRMKFGILVNQVRSENEGLKVFERIAEVGQRFLRASISYAGSVPYDPQVARTIMSRKAATEQSLSTISGQAWARAAAALTDYSMCNYVTAGFWSQFVQVAGL